MAETTRFAPSPTGFLHAGHAFAALSARDLAQADGRFLVRIEDLDGARCRPQYVDAIWDDLHWLGLKWEQPILRQSTRTLAYQEALAHLDQDGLTYPCFCTRREIAAEIERAVEAPHAIDMASDAIKYPGTCRILTSTQRRQRLTEGRPYVMRLDAEKAVERCPKLTFIEMGRGANREHGIIEVKPLLFGDIVLARKNVPAAYHLAVVVDDAFQGVTLVSRGNDLFLSTHVQRLLQALLRLPELRYSHHRLILDERGRKFSKRNMATTLRNLRAAGVDPTQLRQCLFC